jgi:hypothetical protein
MLYTCSQLAGRPNTFAVSAFNRKIATIVRSAPGEVTIRTTGAVSPGDLAAIRDLANSLDGKEPHNCTCKRRRSA